MGKLLDNALTLKKSSLLFGKKIPGQVKEAVKTSTEITNYGGMGTYLGIPEHISGLKRKLFVFLKD